MNPSYFFGENFGDPSTSTSTSHLTNTHPSHDIGPSYTSSPSSSSSSSPKAPVQTVHKTQAQARAAQYPQTSRGPLIEPNTDLNSFLEQFWTRQMDYVEEENPDWKSYNLPLARIKKVMKSDEEVKMISAEAPIMFSKACEIFISELTCRAWLIAESHKRRTLQKSDVAAAIAFSDMFDFLIDIVPRDDGGDADGGGDEDAGGGGVENGGADGHVGNIDGTMTGGEVGGIEDGVGAVAGQEEEQGGVEEEGEGEGEDLYAAYVRED